MIIDNKILEELLIGAQGYITENYAGLIGENNADAKERIYKGIEKYLAIKKQISDSEITQRLFWEMSEYSVLTPYLGQTNVEEIDVNSWKEIVVQYTDGRREKLMDGFLSAKSALDIVKRLLRLSDTVMDSLSPVAEGSLPQDSRIAAITTPIVDEDIGVSCSIRILHPTKRTIEDLIENETANSEMLLFLERCFRGRVSFVIAGATDAGKTTLLGALLKTLPEELRMFVIESGTREFSFVDAEQRNIKGNVVQTLSNTERSGNISQEKLVETALRFNPDVIVVGEMRDIEAYSAVEAAGSGHMVVSTIHASDTKGTLTRMAMLSKKKYAVDFQTAYLQVATAFPIVVCVQKDKNKKRRVTEITEIKIDLEGRVIFNPLFQWACGSFIQVNEASEDIKRKLYDDEMD